MQDITIGRFDKDPEAQGVIRPKDGSWQLVIDKDGYPHLYIRCGLEGHPSGGLLCLEDMTVDGVTIPELMKSTFGGQLSPEEEAKAIEEHLARVGDRPCPR